MIRSLSAEYWKSIKSFDTEEKLDLYFYRPFGFLIAKIAHPLKMTPTQLSFLGVISGVIGGVLFFYNQSNWTLLWASLLFILSGVFDSSDGQLARISGQSTPFGMILDGVCDNIVFLSVYVGCTLTIVPDYGWGIFAIAVFAGFCHSFQSAILDFYNREYIYFGYGKTGPDYWNDSLEEARDIIENSPDPKQRLFCKLRYSWLYQQHALSTRTADERNRMREILLKGTEAQKNQFMEAYRNHNRFILRFWRLMGPNFHTMMIIFFAFMRRFDLYLFLIDILFLSLALLLLRAWQKRKDDQFLNLFGIRSGEQAAR